MRDFVRESNRIEGIHYSGRQLRADIELHNEFLAKDVMVPPTIEGFAVCITRGVGYLRKHDGMDVRVGFYVPPRGGPEVAKALDEWLRWPTRPRSPYEAHIAFEKLHPFMDGNGRTGRALWLWQMGGIENAPLGFLHHFYYQTLEARQS